jgi:Uma2 family endonuclease
MAHPKELERYSYSDFLSWPEWPEGERWELIDGVAYAMAAAPYRNHQGIVGELYRQFANHLLDGPCRVYTSPFDVKLSPDEADDAPTVLEPDVVVCCDPEKLTRQGITGAPDLVVEVVSPGSGVADRKRKFEVYERYGVPEYWITDPVAQVVELYRMEEGGRYRRAGAFGPDESVTPERFPDLSVDLGLVFRDVFA